MEGVGTELGARSITSQDVFSVVSIHPCHATCANQKTPLLPVHDGKLLLLDMIGAGERNVLEGSVLYEMGLSPRWITSRAVYVPHELFINARRHSSLRSIVACKGF